jgi:hypothetical protein
VALLGEFLAFEEIELKCCVEFFALLTEILLSSYVFVLGLLISSKNVPKWIRKYKQKTRTKWEPEHTKPVLHL